MAASPIEHVVVLMMENHSFDHLLGYFPPPIGTLAGTPCCLPNPDLSNPTPTLYITTECNDQQSIAAFNPCPSHSHKDVMQQIYGRTEQQPPWPYPAPMNGFLINYYYAAGGKPGALMSGLAPSSLPTLCSLATHFTVCTNWFCSVPGPTGPNRLFANCASSGGYAGADFKNMPAQLAKLPSVFYRLSKHNLSWQIYHEDADFATELVLDTVQAQPSALPADTGFQRFQSDARSGTLANYVFLTPTLPNSQHDGYGVGPLPGDRIMCDVYSAIFNSPLWDRTLLLITYDEHGGHYDHVPPPLSYKNDAGRCVTIPNPDGCRWDQATWNDDFSPPEFDFTCLGPRVPAILVSAYTPAGVDATIYEHASISATLNELWGIGTLTKRDAGASSFLKNVNPSVKRPADTLPLLVRERKD